jgi:hypothetical protein
MYVIEFKRFAGRADRQQDIERLRSIIRQRTAASGLFAAPCYLKEKDPDNWPLLLKEELERDNSDLRCHLSDCELLPRKYRNAEGRTREQAMVIEVIGKG